MDNAAYCSNLGYFSAKLLLESGCGFGWSFSDEGSVLDKNAVTAGYDLETTIYIFVSRELTIYAQRQERGQSMPYLAGGMAETPSQWSFRHPEGT